MNITRRRLFKGLAGVTAVAVVAPAELLTPVQIVQIPYDYEKWLAKFTLNSTFGKMGNIYALPSICRMPGETDSQLRERFKHVKK